MSETEKRGRPEAPTAENFITVYTDGVEVPNEDRAQLHAMTAGITSMTVRDLIARCKQGKIRGYGHNRGNGKIVPSTVTKIAHNFVPHAIGQLTFSESGIAVDGHNRIGGICHRAQVGKMTESDWDALIPVRVVTAGQFIETYKYLGDVKAHSIGDHLSNPDLLLGSCIVGENGLYSYLKQVNCPDEWMKILTTNSALTIIANIMTAQHLINAGRVPESIGKIKGYADAYKVRQTMSTMARELKGSDFRLIHPKDYVKITEGCTYYARFRMALRDKKMKDDALPCIKSLTKGGLMGLIISDVVFNGDHRRFTSMTPEVLASRLLIRAEKVEKVLADILGSNNKNAEEAVKTVINLALRPVTGE